MKINNKILVRFYQWFYCNNIEQRGNMFYKYKVIQIKGIATVVVDHCDHKFRHCWSRSVVTYFWDIKSFFHFIYHRFIKNRELSNA